MIEYRFRAFNSSSQMILVKYVISLFVVFTRMRIGHTLSVLHLFIECPEFNKLCPSINYANETTEKAVNINNLDELFCFLKRTNFSYCI